MKTKAALTFTKVIHAIPDALLALKCHRAEQNGQLEAFEHVTTEPGELQPVAVFRRTREDITHFAPDGMTVVSEQILPLPEVTKKAAQTAREAARLAGFLSRHRPESSRLPGAMSVRSAMNFADHNLRAYSRALEPGKSA